jgi:hypothetical protein
VVKQNINKVKLKEMSKTKKVTEKEKSENTELILINNEDIFKAVESLPPGRNKKGDGEKVKQITCQFNISISTVYLVKRILKYGSQELIDDVRTGRKTIKEGAKMLNIKKAK